MSDSNIEYFDRLLGNLQGLPDVVKTKPTTIRVVVPLVGAAQTYIVQTYRQPELGDTVFLEYIAQGRSERIVLVPAVTALIARQRDTLTGKNRRVGARKAVQTRKERGIEPGFLKHKKGA
jgi:hypothetical protein